MNAVIPGVYFAVLDRLFSDMYDDEKDFSTGKRLKAKRPVVGKGKSDDDDDEEYLIEKRWWTWRTLTYMHSMIWGPGFVLFIMSFFGEMMSKWYRYYIEYFLSNVNYLAYLTGIILLSISVV